MPSTARSGGRLHAERFMTLTDSPSTMRPAIMAIEGVMRRCLENQMTSEMGGQLLLP